MFTRQIKNFALAAVLAASSTLWAQSLETKQAKAKVDSLARRLAKAHESQAVMSKRADSLAQAISRLKNQTATPLNAPALEAALRHSKTWAEALQKTQAEEHFLDQVLRQKAEILLKNLSADFARIEQEKKRKQREKELQQELKVCRQWQEQCRKILESPPTRILIYEVRVEPEDDANALQRKADFLLDQSDRLERESKRVEKKLAEMREEESVRARMHDFSDELALLEPNNEVGRGGNVSQGTSSQETGILDGGLRANDLGNAGYSSAEAWVLTFNLPNNVGKLSQENLSDWIKHLEQTHKRLRAQADSLRQRATDFEALRQTRHD